MRKTIFLAAAVLCLLLSCPVDRSVGQRENLNNFFRTLSLLSLTTAVERPDICPISG